MENEPHKVLNVFRKEATGSKGTTFTSGKDEPLRRAKCVTQPRLMIISKCDVDVVAHFRTSGILSHPFL